MNELSLFSGYGGFSLGLRLAGLDIKTVGYVEIDDYCQRILQARIRDGVLDWAPITRDIRAADFKSMAGLVDIITAGFPCQPHSVAGQRRGEADERNLWPDTLSVIRDVGPSYVLLENVPGLLTNGYAGTVVGQLSEIGYDCIWDCVSAASVGAPHLRWRWWCLAYARSNEWDSGRCSEDHLLAPQWRPTGAKQEWDRRECRVNTMGTAVPQDGDVANVEREPGTLRATKGAGPRESPGGSVEMAHANGTGQAELCRIRTDAQSPGRYQSCTDGWWAVEPPMGRVANGVGNRVGQLRSLGNGIIPAVVVKFLKG